MLPIPINEKPNYNVDPVSNANELWDGYIDETGTLRKRPGYEVFTDIGPDYIGQGIFYWDAMNVCIAVSNGIIYKIDQLGVVTELTGATLLKTGAVSFADGQYLDQTPILYMANGGRMVYITDNALYSVSDIGAPNKVSHVGYLNLRFVANEVGTARFYFTDTNPATNQLDPTYWSSSDNPLTDDAKGDNILSLKVAWNEIVTFGSQGFSVWQDDGATPFSPIVGAFSEAGLAAAQSVAQADNTFFALCQIDKKPCVIRLAGRTPQIISEPISRQLASYSRLDDAIGTVVSVGGIAVYLLHLPTENITWAYDYAHDIWARWGKWDHHAGEYDAFEGQHFTYAKKWNKCLMQSRENGNVYVLSRDIFTDNGDILRTMKRTSWIGDNSRRSLEQLYVRVKSTTQAGESANLQMRWRDDGRPNWSKVMNIPVKNTMGADFISKNNRFGTFRARQFEFVLSDDADLALVSAEADTSPRMN